MLVAVCYVLFVFRWQGGCNPLYPLQMLSVFDSFSMDTFMRLCKDLDCSLLEVKKQASLPLDMPSVLLVDNVSSQLNYDTLVKIKSPTGFHIYHVPGTHIYLLLGVPNRSHMLHSGD